MIPDLSAYYRIYTPKEFPFQFWADGYWKLEADCGCVSCGRKFQIYLRTHKYFTGGSALALKMPTKRPNPNDAQIISTFMVKACNHGVGCSNPDNFFTDSVGKMQPKIYDHLLWKSKDCLHAPETNCPLCQPCVMPVKWLKYAPQLHTRECPVGRAVRTGPFQLSGLQTAAGMKK